MASLQADDRDDEPTAVVRSDGNEASVQSDRPEMPALQSDGAIADLSFICFIVILSAVVFACFL